MAESKAPDPPRPLTDSPWFWFFVFGIAALAALLVIGPKHVRRQERLVRMQHSRDTSDAYRAGKELPTTADDSQPGGEATLRTVVTILLVLLIVVGWALLIRRRMQHTAAASRAGPDDGR